MSTIDPLEYVQSFMLIKFRLLPEVILRSRSLYAIFAILISLL